MIHHLTFPTAVRFGPGARALVAEDLRTHGARRPLVVTDRGLAGLPIVTEFVAGLRHAGLEVMVFSGVHGNPTLAQVEAGVTAWRAHAGDALVGLGGGAALDVTKAVALLAHHPGSLFHYAVDAPHPRAIDRPIPHWVAVPTTAGTGSEVGRSAVVSDDTTRVKRVVFSPRLLARAVFADPEFTIGLPPAVTAATGFDALTHCVEAFLAKGWHPLCDGIALEGVRLAARHLATCVHEGGNLTARGQMLAVSLMGGVAFQKGLGVVHSCAHALAAVADLHHGLANGVMIDHALRHNLAAVPDRFAALCDAVGLQGRSGHLVIDWLAGLKRDLGIPAGLRAAGVDPARLDELADRALADGCHHENPAPCSRADMVAIFHEAFA